MEEVKDDDTVIQEKLVAIKLVKKDFLGEADENDTTGHKVRFEREVANLTKFKDKDYCLQIVEYMELEKHVILITDLIYGTDLWNLREKCRQSALLEEEVRNVMHKAC